MRTFSDLVRHPGNEALFDAVELSLLSTRLGWPLHLHAEGVRGTGKTTVLRAVRRFLPHIARIRGCLYNCDPSAPHCPQHRDLTPEQVADLGVELVPMPFLEISHSARLGTVVGTIDLQRVMAAERPEAVLLPGTLAKAHRGIVFVDEINRLADTAPELVDALLDVMGTKPGRLQIEESGLPTVDLPVQVTVWAASNPDEEPGPLEDIRRQLADRFDLAVHVRRPQEVAQVRSVLDRTAAMHPGWKASPPSVGPVPGGTDGDPDPAPPTVPVMPDDLRTLLAELYVRFDLESLRAVEAWQWSSRLNAARTQRDRVRREDVLAVAPLVLHHRLEPETLGDLLRALREERPAAAEMAASAAEAQQGLYDGPEGAPGPGGRRGRSGMGRDDQLPGDPDGRHGRDTLLSRLRALLQGDERRAGAYHRRGGAGSVGGHGPGRGGRVPGAGMGGDPGAAGGRGSTGAGRRPEMPAPPHRARPLHQMPVTDIAARLGCGIEVPPEHRVQAPPEARTQVPPEHRKEDRTGDHGSGR
ncbi:MAG TPA: magnesium chelatase [Bacillota bacterium]